MTATLTKQFDAALLDAYRRAKLECGYHASYFFNMLHEFGGVETARRLAHGAPASGFTRLWELGRLDLTVEAQMLRTEYRALFAEDTLALARARLREYGYSVDATGV